MVSPILTLADKPMASQGDEKPLYLSPWCYLVIDWKHGKRMRSCHQPSSRWRR